MNWTAEHIKWFMEQPPPRQVDEKLLNDAINVLIPKIARIILYILPIMVMIVMGMMLTLLAMTVDLKGEWRLLTGPLASAPGKVLNVERKKGSKGAITFIYDYEFTPADSREMSGSRVRGVSFSDDRITSAGQTVTIEYIPDNPAVSRIQGARYTPVPLLPIVVLPFVGVAVVILVPAMIRYKKKWLHGLLAHGVSTAATIEKIKPGPKGAIIVHVLYEINGEIIKSKTSTNGRRGEKERLQSIQDSGRPVAVLVNPDKPKNFFLLDLLMSARNW